MPVQITCDHCGKTFSVTPSRAKNYKTHFCSWACMQADHAGDGNPNWKGGLVYGTCLVCGAETKTKRSHAQQGAGKFCSRKCKGIWKTQNAIGYDPASRIAKHCTVCGKEILVKLSHIDHEGTYCSRECMSSGYKRVLAGDSNPNYRHGQAGTADYQNAWSKEWRSKNKVKVRIRNAQTRAWRRSIPGKFTRKDVAYLMRQQDGECVLCHCSVRDRYHIDHRIPIARGGHNFVGNLQLLCPTCNLKKHTKFMVEIRYGKKVSP